MKQIRWLVFVGLAVFVDAAGCGGGGNSVEFPENPDPMPKEPPVAAGAAAPPAPSEASKAIEQP